MALSDIPIAALDGRAVRRFRPRTGPTSDVVVGAVEAALPR